MAEPVTKIKQERLPHCDPIDTPSHRKLFGWDKISDVVVPCIFRLDEQNQQVKFTAAGIVEGQLLFRKYDKNTLTTAKEKVCVPSKNMTVVEADLLNEINIEHSGGLLTDEPFTDNHKLVPVEDVKKFVECLSSIANSTSESKSKASNPELVVSEKNTVNSTDMTQTRTATTVLPSTQSPNVSISNGYSEHGDVVSNTAGIRKLGMLNNCVRISFVRNNTTYIPLSFMTDCHQSLLLAAEEISLVNKEKALLQTLVHELSVPIKLTNFEPVTKVIRTDYLENSGYVEIDIAALAKKPGSIICVMTTLGREYVPKKAFLAILEKFMRGPMNAAEQTPSNQKPKGHTVRPTPTNFNVIGDITNHNNGTLSAHSNGDITNGQGPTTNSNYSSTFFSAIVKEAQIVNTVVPCFECLIDSIQDYFIPTELSLMLVWEMEVSHLMDEKSILQLLNTYNVPLFNMTEEQITSIKKFLKIPEKERDALSGTMIPRRFLESSRGTAVRDKIVQQLLVLHASR